MKYFSIICIAGIMLGLALALRTCQYIKERQRNYELMYWYDSTNAAFDIFMAKWWAENYRVEDSIKTSKIKP